MVSPSEGLGKRVLITGASGFTGRYVIDQLRAEGWEVVQLSSTGTTTSSSVNLLNRDALRDVLQTLRPHAVVHLAAISFVAHGDAEEIYRVNIVGTRNLLEALAELPSPPSHILLVSSANVYGNIGGVLDEQSPLFPQNDYAVSKMAMEAMAQLWADRLPITIVRPFNYTGVGQSERFLIPKIVSHFQRRDEVIELGNLDVSRDFYDVRHVAQLYGRLLALPAAGEVYNVCSGVEWSLEQVIDTLRDLSGHAIKVRVNPSFVRANEVKSLRGSNNKLRSVVEALPKFDFSSTLSWMYGAIE
ncbi:MULTISPECIES: NAD-dependent epimerase/dehydratase family protein [Xanthomonas]|uniref:NAD-dependent epimerase/dehydratase family protein n=1 Tax=Xanthomonas sp. Leaf148 TaxID=1736275 RepID=UPI000B2AEFAB|nr:MULTISPECIES: NAD-dependent epimerase/dehydratase family protein [Xanthomonas]